MLHGRESFIFQVYGIAPENLVSVHVYQLHIDTQIIAIFKKASGQKGVNVQLIRHFVRINLLALILLYVRRRANCKRANETEFGNDSVSQREAKKICLLIRFQITKGKNRKRVWLCSRAHLPILSMAD